MCNSQLFSVVFLFLVGFCFLKPRVCWLLFSSSVVALSICLDYCLVLLLGWLCVARVLLALPNPPKAPTFRRPSVLEFRSPLTVGRRKPPSTVPLEVRSPSGTAGGDPPLTGPSPQALEPWPPIASGPSPSVREGSHQ